MTEPLLRVEALTKHFPVRGGGLLKAVDGVDFRIQQGGALGLVGESGCGKTTIGRMLVRLLEPTSGRIVFDGRDISHLRRAELRPLRRELQIIFQDPYASLNPRHTVGRIVAMPLQVNRIRPTGGLQKRVQELLELVGLNPEHYNRYPHEFSGGQRQRIGIARSLAVQPKLIVADEPVSALDVSIQAQVVNLLRDCKRELGLAFVFIAHDLAVVRHFCQRGGRDVPRQDRRDRRPGRHLSSTRSTPIPGRCCRRSRTGRHSVRRDRIRLTGEVPTPLDPPSGCRFRTRCARAQDMCAAAGTGADDPWPRPANRLPFPALGSPEVRNPSGQRATGTARPGPAAGPSPSETGESGGPLAEQSEALTAAGPPLLADHADRTRNPEVGVGRSPAQLAWLRLRRDRTGLVSGIALGCTAAGRAGRAADRDGRTASARRNSSRTGSTATACRWATPVEFPASTGSGWSRAWAGTSSSGLVYGMRTSLLIALAAATVTTTLGVVAGRRRRLPRRLGRRGDQLDHRPGPGHCRS